MAAMYVDTSALVKRYVAEVGSAWVRRAVVRPVNQVIYTAALTQAEVISALQRLVREGRLDTAEAQRLTQRVTHHFARRYQGSGSPGRSLRRRVRRWRPIHCGRTMLSIWPVP